MREQEAIFDNFEKLWNLGLCQEALQYYRQLTEGLAFQYAEKVGEYLEEQGRSAEAMKEYEMAMRIYKEMNILPLPGGPVGLYKLGVWYADKNPLKATEYLERYLKADTDWVCYQGRLIFKEPAKTLLAQLIDSQFNQIIKTHEHPAE